MQVDDYILNCAAFLGEPGAGTFRVHGTGFFVYLTDGEHDFTYLVTASHVVWPGRRAPGPQTAPEGEIYIRVNRKSGGPKDIPTQRKDWLFPKSKWLDVCAYVFDDSQYTGAEEIEIGKLNILNLASLAPEDRERFGLPAVHPFRPYYRASLGEEIFIVGAFISRVGEKKNIPIIRTGIIAAMPEEPVEFFSPSKPAYLVEIRSLGGLSGSPMFLRLVSGDIPGRAQRQVFGPVTEMRADGTVARKDVVIVPYVIIGMILGAHSSGDYARDFIEAPDGSVKVIDTELNSGIAVAMPAVQIVDFLFEEEFRQARAATIEHRRRLAGYTGP